MKIQNLRFFAAVVDLGGVSKAAERLRLSQPTVSAGLKALEIELGHSLFQRDDGRRLRPTAKALEFHRNVTEILRQCDVASAMFRSAEEHPPSLKVGVLPTIAGSAVGAFADALARRDPGTRLQLWEGSPGRLVEWMRQGRIDAAWTTVDADGAQARVAWQERFVALVPPTHRLARNRSVVALADLDGEAIVLRGSCEVPRGALWPSGLRLRIAARAERDELALRLVASGLGLAIAPRSLATSEVVVRHIRDLDRTRSIGLRWNAGLPNAAVAHLLDAIASSHNAADAEF